MNNNIGSLLPTVSPTVTAIFDWHKKRGDNEDERGYLGASAIGHHCERMLWYDFRLCIARDFPGRLYRLFNTGDREEERMVEELRGIGCEVHDVDENGEQFGFKDLGGHFSGHCDGTGLGILEAPKTWHVLEFKTHNDKSFKKLQKEGVEKSKPQHYAQMMIYMGQMGLKRALYQAKNKNDDDLYIERIRFDSKVYKRFMAKAERVIRSSPPPVRCADRPDTFACKWCDAYKLCWGTSDVAVPLPSKTCRTCCHVTPEIDEGEDYARWSCALHQKDISFEEQQVGCDSHILIPDLISFATVADSGESWIEFENSTDGTRWRHGNGSDGSWRTEELLKTPGPIVGHPAVNAVKDAFNGEIDYIDDLTLIERYPPEDCEKLWDGNPDENDTIFEVISKEGVDPYHDITCEYESDTHDAYEFGNKICLVVYKEHNHAAIWKGKE